MTPTQSSKTRKVSPILKNLMREVALQTGRTKAVINPKGEISISDAILQIIEPYRQDAPDYQSYYKLVMLACAAWNACILPAQEREAMLQDMLAAMPPDPQKRTDFMDTIHALMARKKKLFPHVSRMILKFKVTDRGDDFHIAVASTIGK